MSKTVHYRGKLKFNSEGHYNCIKSAREILQNKNEKLKDYYENELEHLCDEYYEEYFYHPKTETLYEIISKFEHDLEEEIIEVKRTDDPWEFEYELRYYNGGAGFTECLEEAMDKLNNK
jgi:hypothetical protein